jgi:hypothetical protein
MIFAYRQNVDGILITGFVTGVTHRMALPVEQELLTLLEHLSSPPGF